MKKIKKDTELYYFLKRFIDIMVSLFFLIVFSPLLIIIAIIVKAEDGGRVIYKQIRIGKNEKKIKIYKFRSMIDKERVVNAQVYINSPEVTKIGKFIRRYKIDEIPQFINVLKGDLSIIGPRPCLPETLLLFREKSKIRHSVKPGLSGLSQINGNIYLTWEERLEYDIEYIKKMSLRTDIDIFIKTLYIIFAGEDKGWKEK